MDEPTYFKLLQLVTPLITKQDTNMRQAISPHERLCATLRFLASGMSYEELKFPTVISPQRLGVIIPETCKAILTVLKDYMKVPATEEELSQEDSKKDGSFLTVSDLLTENASGSYHLLDLDPVSLTIKSFLVLFSWLALMPTTKLFGAKLE
ncbi:hypothetical protein PYW07_006609 [Mythimna separata]|uniref:Uncharacterized protein n=1 Tax=Mythimna separata TaxID=271217 RepID=A0AAD8DWX3_MYTSE|nr:hypothetical protein PYW07_006609 [Mythimna separata]